MRHAPASIVRKPLLPAELDARQKTVLVTGATGYIGSRVVERLLAAGNNVHVLARRRPTADPEDMLLYLKGLPGAREQMKVISGDVTNHDSLAAAMDGCDQLVHLAAVVDLLTPKDEQQKQAMVDTAVQGTRMVLDAATNTRTISKVLLCSSIVAVMWDWWERGSDHVYTEVDWTLDKSVNLNTYAYCKRESERLAYKMSAGKSWELVTINPGIVFGPVATRKLAQSLSVMAPIVEHMNGKKYPFTSNMYVSHVDLDDVASGICGLLATPGATGRYIMMSSSNPPSMVQIARLLAKAYPQAKVPPLTAPAWAVAHLAKHKSEKLGFDLHKFKAMHNKPYKVDASKITRTLRGFTYIPLEDSVKAAADSVVAMGLAAMKPLACCTAPLALENSSVAYCGGGPYEVVAEIIPKPPATHAPAAAAAPVATAAAVVAPQQQQQMEVQMLQHVLQTMKSIDLQQPGVAASAAAAAAAGGASGAGILSMTSMKSIELGGMPDSPVGATGDDAISAVAQ